MITDINKKTLIKELDKSKLPSHWNDYYEYDNNVELSNLTKTKFLNEIKAQKGEQKPFINSQILISKVLTEFGKKHTFHRQFKEKHPNLNSAQILGMQLYDIIVQDNDEWIYLETKEKDHLFSHATYFK